ncbi:MAG: glycosyltransferase family 4 protein [Brevibacterium sp.]|uniref:glycosyltransferase family 4 protein n=1 Tax=Brevibacterium sp. TaxID=1701 RepID=UPI002647C67D|nr:glycosyltransferase family 4 protein [Brevibacterium sp.]MDN5806985.1 glycosyltransferase family 4 protein [Brevibacterium sp.]MDN5832959.1 glycosyltransferase family 4 protein [Brevibacterium sp.]MDN5875282.1 glycosyltransferase family 4 protein [Brevibacterium sp.]MDN5908379.1 glycosyltransferase family 4 protein [Brevibacterium sp.]MDN6135000.1 glycosyltransferase family 4 protein [Brevibacterium sp.]
MRIAYILLDPGIGVFGTKGASVHVQEVVRAFRNLGHEVSIFCTRADDDIPTDLADLDVTRLEVSRGLGRGQREIALLRLSDILADMVVDTVTEAGPGFDLVYERYSLFSTAGAQISDRLGVPLVLEVNAPLLDEQKQHRGLVHDEHAARTTAHSFVEADRIVCVSSTVAEWVRRDYPGLRDVAVVPNGVNTDRITPATPASGRITPATPASATAVPEAGPVDDRSGHGSAVRIGFVGTLKPWHGTDRLIDACAGLNGNFHLDILGHGPEAQSLQEQAKDRRLGSRVTFHGAIAPAEIPARLRTFDIAVAPYPAGENYFSPLKIYEYLAAGLPIVASAVGSIPAVLEGTGSATLVPADDTDALTGALQDLIDDAEVRAQMGAAGRSEALTHHSWASRCQEILAPFALESV